MLPPASIEARVEGAPRVFGVPPGVNDRQAVVELERVHEDIAQWVVRDRDRNRPETRTNLLHRRHYLPVPRLFLEHSGDLNHGLSPYVGRARPTNGGAERRVGVPQFEV